MDPLLRPIVPGCPAARRGARGLVDTGDTEPAWSPPHGQGAFLRSAMARVAALSALPPWPIGWPRPGPSMSESITTACSRTTRSFTSCRRSIAWDGRTVKGQRADQPEGRDLAVGLEMLPRRLQPQLDAYLAGAIDEEGFSAVDWAHTWGFDFALYRPIFDFCRTHGLRMYALNAPREPRRRPSARPRRSVPRRGGPASSGAPGPCLSRIAASCATSSTSTALPRRPQPRRSRRPRCRLRGATPPS